MKFWKRKYWLLVMATGFLFMLSPFAVPILLTILLFFVGMPLFSTGLLMFILTKPGRIPKWKFTDVYALTIYRDHTYGVDHYNPNFYDSSQLPEHIRPYAKDYRYIIPLRGWVPLTKYDGFMTKMKKGLKRIVKPKRNGLLLFAEEKTDHDGKMVPIDHAHSYQAEYDAVSPEYLKKVCESKLAANFSRSIDQPKVKMNWLIIAIVIIVALGVVLKLTGAF